MRHNCEHTNWSWKGRYRICNACGKREDLDPCLECEGYGGAFKIISGKILKGGRQLHDSKVEDGYCKECLGYGFVTKKEEVAA